MSLSLVRCIPHAPPHYLGLAQALPRAKIGMNSDNAHFLAFMQSRYPLLLNIWFVSVCEVFCETCLYKVNILVKGEGSGNNYGWASDMYTDHFDPHT